MLPGCDLRTGALVGRLRHSCRAILPMVALGCGFAAGLAPGAGAAGYYNLGAFWRGSSSSSCTSLSANFVQVVDSGNLSAPSAITTPQFTEYAGDTLIALGYYSVTASSQSLTDTAGLAWHPVLTNANTNTDCSGGAGKLSIWYASVTTTGHNTVTLSPSPYTTGEDWLQVLEYSNIATSSVVAAFASGLPTNGVPTANMTAGTVSTSATSSLVLSVFDNVQDNCSPNMSTTSGYNTEFVGSCYNTIVLDNVAAGAGAHSVTATDNASSDCWMSATVALNTSCVATSTLTPSFAVLNPVLPEGSPVAGNVSITITGNQFDSGATVTVGGTNCPVTGRSGTSSITCTAPSGSAGAADVVVTNSNGHSGTLRGGFIYGTAGTEQWLGAVATGWGWQTFSVTSPTGFIGGAGSMQDSTFSTNLSGVAFSNDGHNTWLYVADEGAKQIMKFNASTGAYVGWIGEINSTPTGDPESMGCTSILPFNLTPGWCTGGSSAVGYADGEYNQPVGVAVDPTGATLFMVDAVNQRVNKYNASTGAYLGGIGRIAQSNGSNCTTTGAIPTGWCSPASSGYWGGSESGTAGGAFNTPSSIAVDPSGTYLYVMDFGNSRVEQFNASTGAFVGWLGGVNSATGMACATSNPGCVLGASGAFSGGFVTGGSSKSLTSTVMGAFQYNSGGGLSSLAVDANYLYVAEYYNNRVERFNLPSGTFAGWMGWENTAATACVTPGCSTTANAFSNGFVTGGSAKSGTGTGAFDAPSGIAVDSNYIYVSDNNNNRVERFTLAGASPYWTGAVNSTPTGGLTINCMFSTSYQNPTPGWCSGGTSTSSTDSTLASFAGGVGMPLGLAADATSGKLYVVDRDDSRIIRYTSSTGVYEAQLVNAPIAPTGWTTGGESVGTWADGGFASVDTGQPYWDIALDSTNNALYASDPGNSRVLRFNLTTGAPQGWIGTVAFTPSGPNTSCTSTAAGSPTPGWCTGGGASGYISQGTGDGEFNYATGLAVDPTANYLYVVDLGNSRVQRFKISDGTVQGFVGLITTAGTGCGASTGVTSSWCAGSGATTGSGSADGALNTPVSVGVDSTGNLYVSDGGNNRIVKYNASGAFQGWIGYGTNSGGTGGCPGASAASATGWCKGGTSTFATNSANGAFNNPTWLSVDSQNNLWVFDNGNTRVQKFSASTGAYLDSISLFWSDPVYVGVFGVDPAGKSLFFYENDNWQMAFTRYNASTHGFMGKFGTVNAAPPGTGQSGCPSVTATTTPADWCLPTSSSSPWIGPNSWADPTSARIVFDSGNNYMYFFDSANYRVVRVPFNN